MSSNAVQALLITLGALVFAGMVLHLARRGRLSLRYTLGWFAVSAFLVVFALFAGVLQSVAATVGISPTGVLLGGVASVLLLITVQLSVTASGLRDSVQDLAEAHALLEQRLSESDRAEPTERP